MISILNEPTSEQKAAVWEEWEEKKEEPVQSVADEEGKIDDSLTEEQIYERFEKEEKECRAKFGSWAAFNEKRLCQKSWWDGRRELACFPEEFSVFVKPSSRWLLHLVAVPYGIYNFLSLEFEHLNLVKKMQHYMKTLAGKVLTPDSPEQKCYLNIIAEFGNRPDVLKRRFKDFVFQNEGKLLNIFTTFSELHPGTISSHQLSLHGVLLKTKMLQTGYGPPIYIRMRGKAPVDRIMRVLRRFRGGVLREARLCVTNIIPKRNQVFRCVCRGRCGKGPSEDSFHCEEHEPIWDWSNQRLIFTAGDSNSHVFSMLKKIDHTLDIHDLVFPGATACGLPNPASKTMAAGEKILRKLSNIRSQEGCPDFIFLMFGSVDLDITILHKQKVEKKNISAWEVIMTSIRKYEEFLHKLWSQFELDRDRPQICLVGNQPPIIESKLIPMDGMIRGLPDGDLPTFKDRIDWMHIYNSRLRLLAERMNFRYFDIVEDVLNEKGDGIDKKWKRRDMLDNHLNEAKTWSLYREKLYSVFFRT